MFHGAPKFVKQFILEIPFLCVISKENSHKQSAKSNVSACYFIQWHLFFFAIFLIWKLDFKADTRNKCMHIALQLRSRRKK